MSIETVKDILEIIAIVIAAIIAIRINWKFVPIIFLDITSEWIDKETGKLKLKLTIENKSNVKAVKKFFWLQVLEYDLKQTSTISEWVPFFEPDIKPNEKPVFWKEPVDVWQSTVEIYPGEISSLDYLCTCPKNRMIKVALFFGGKPDFFSQLRRADETWCTTKIFANP
jgi:hypothetical protein